MGPIAAYYKIPEERVLAVCLSNTSPVDFEQDAISWIHVYMLSSFKLYFWSGYLPVLFFSFVDL